MLDTSVLIAGLVEHHTFHSLARPHVVATLRSRVPGIVLAEAWAALRRAPWNFDAATVAQSLAPWSTSDRIIPTSTDVYVSVLRMGRSLNLGGNIHDALIAHACALDGGSLVTLDRRQAAIARTVPGLTVSLLLPDGEPNGGAGSPRQEPR